MGLTEQEELEFLTLKRKRAMAQPDLQGGLTPGTAPQSAGVVPTDHELKSMAFSLVPEKEDIPELLGSMAGAAKRTTIPGMALSAAGAAVGEGVKQLGQRAGFFEGQPPQTSLEAAKRMGGAALRGGIGEGAGRGVAKLFRPFVESFTPAIKEGLKIAEREGITPPLSTMTESRGVQALERAAESQLNPFASRLTKMRNKAVEDFGLFVNHVADKIGTSRPAEVQGGILKESIDGFTKKFTEVKNSLYNEVWPKVKDLPVTLDNTINELNDILSRKEVVGFGQEDIFKKISNVFSSGKISKVNQLREAKKSIESMINFNDPSIRGANNELKNVAFAMMKDIDETVSSASPELSQSLKKANEYFANGIELMKDKAFKQLSKASPSNMHKIIIRPQSPEIVRLSKEILGDDVFREAARQWFDDVVSRSTKIIEGERVLSPKALAGNLSKYGATVDEIFIESPEVRKLVRDVESLGTMMSRGEKITQGSQTAFIISSLAPILTFFSNPAAALQMAGALGGIMAGTAVLGSKAGRKFLTEGIPGGKIAGRGAQILTERILQEKNK